MNWGKFFLSILFLCSYLLSAQVAVNALSDVYYISPIANGYITGGGDAVNQVLTVTNYQC